VDPSSSTSGAGQAPTGGPPGSSPAAPPDAAPARALTLEQLPVAIPIGSAGVRDFVLAIDFGGTKIAIAVVGLDGRVLDSRRLPTHAADGARQAIDRTVAAACALIKAAEEGRRGRCVAIGAVTPGIALADRVVLAPNVPGWDGLALEQLLAERLDVPLVAVDNDAKGAALAEARWGELRGVDPGLYVTLGTGLAAAVVIGGEVLSGAHGAAGEIGYNRTGIGAFSLEDVAGGKAIGPRASRLLDRSITTAEAFASEHPGVRRLVRETLEELARHVAAAVNLVDPARIAVGGGLMGSGSYILSTLGEQLQAIVPFPPELVPARFPYDGALIGAVALALDAIEAPARAADGAVAEGQAS
jgi:glucokinase